MIDPVIFHDLDHPGVRIMIGDVTEQLAALPDESVQTVVTSPPYWGLRDYGAPGQIGLERTIAEYVERISGVFAEVRRVLRADGTLWLNMGDCYNAYNGNAGPNSGAWSVGWQSQARPKLETGHGLRDPSLKPKELVGMPWRVAFRLQADGWYLRQENIWHKPNPMPESVKDRCTRSHEHVFLLAKSRRYYFDGEAIREPASKGASGSFFDKGKTAIHQLNRSSEKQRATSDFRNKRSVWTVAPAQYKEAHFATFPPKLIEPCILAGAPPGAIVLDPFAGSGTTAQVALDTGRRAIMIELKPEYVELIKKRIER